MSSCPVVSLQYKSFELPFMSLVVIFGFTFVCVDRMSVYLSVGTPSYIVSLVWKCAPWRPWMLLLVLFLSKSRSVNILLRVLLDCLSATTTNSTNYNCDSYLLTASQHQTYLQVDLEWRNMAKFSISRRLFTIWRFRATCLVIFVRTWFTFIPSVEFWESCLVGDSWKIQVVVTLYTDFDYLEHCWLSILHNKIFCDILTLTIGA